MREVIEKMLEIERRARRIVAKAEAQALQMTDEARRDARETVEAARQEALAKVEPLVQEAVADAEKMKQARLAELRARFQAEKERHTKQVPAAAKKLLPFLLGTADGVASDAHVAGARKPDPPQSAPPTPTGPVP